MSIVYYLSYFTEEKKECEDYNQTTTAELSEREEEEEPKRKRKKKSYPDCVTG